MVSGCSFDATGVTEGPATSTGTTLDPVNMTPTTSGSESTSSSSGEESTTESLPTGSSTDPVDTDSTSSESTSSSSGDVETDSSTGSDCAEGALTCDDLNLERCEGVPTLEDLLKSLIDPLDSAYLSCCPDVSSVQAQAICLNLISDDVDVSKAATKCDQAQLMAKLPTTPTQRVIIEEKEPQAFKIYSTVTLTTARGCGFTANWPLESIIVYGQEGPCDQEAPGQPNLTVMQIQVVFTDPLTNKIAFAEGDLAPGQVQIEFGSLYSANGDLKPFNIRGQASTPNKQECVGFQAVDGSDVEIVGVPPTNNFTP